MKIVETGGIHWNEQLPAPGDGYKGFYQLTSGV
jgi:hypothetical protein